MIIIDLNQVIISNIMAQVGTHTNVPIEINLIRHMVLNTIRSIKMRHKKTHGDELVIATDGRHYWRKDVFPYYKSNRAASRKESDFDWNTLFECMNMLREELDQNFPYPVIHFDRAEADDIIGTICNRFGVVFGNGPIGRIMISSGDGDFAQLQKYSNVDQYDPIRGKAITVGDATKYLREHIIRGDFGDGIPNIFSPDNSIADKVRQKKCTQKLLDTWMAYDPRGNTSDNNTEIVRNFARNEQLIDLDFIPRTLQNEINFEYDKQSTSKNRSKLFNYFVKNRLTNLLEDIQDF